VPPDRHETFGPWRRVRVIGRGSVGTVYEAEAADGRRAALKLLHRDLARDPELRSRFVREAEAVSRLHHPNIVSVVDTGEADGQPYIALEYIDGTDVAQIVASRPSMSVEWKVDLVRQICEGLGHAHAHGVVHRDVKPANVRVTPAGDVKVMDFGMARLGGASDLTRRGHLLGTIHYCAPEQLEGDASDPRVDVFSVGAIAYELLSWRRPFEADSVAGVLNKLLEQPVDPAPLPQSDYSPGLERVVLKALERDPDRRHASLDAMRGELFDVVRGTASRLGVAPVRTSEGRHLG